MRKKIALIRTFLDDDLPPGWGMATISDLVGKDGVFKDGDWVESKDQDPNGDVRLIQLADIGDGKGDSDYLCPSSKHHISLLCPGVGRSPGSV